MSWTPSTVIEFDDGRGDHKQAASRNWKCQGNPFFPADSRRYYDIPVTEFYPNETFAKPLIDRIEWWQTSVVLSLKICRNLLQYPKETSTMTIIIITIVIEHLICYALGQECHIFHSILLP